MSIDWQKIIDYVYDKDVGISLVQDAWVWSTTSNTHGVVAEYPEKQYTATSTEIEPYDFYCAQEGVKHYSVLNMIRESYSMLNSESLCAQLRRYSVLKSGLFAYFEDSAEACGSLTCIEGDVRTYLRAMLLLQLGLVRCIKQALKRDTPLINQTLADGFCVYACVNEKQKENTQAIERTGALTQSSISVAPISFAVQFTIPETCYKYLSSQYFNYMLNYAAYKYPAQARHQLYFLHKTFYSFRVWLVKSNKVLITFACPNLPFITTRQLVQGLLNMLINDEVKESKNE